MRQGRNLRCEGLDPPIGERPKNERTQTRVTRRLKLQHGMRFYRVKWGEVVWDFPRRHRFPSEPPITQDRVDRLMGGGDGKAVIRPVDQRPGIPGAGVKRVGVLDERRLGRRLRE